MEKDEAQRNRGEETSKPKIQKLDDGRGLIDLVSVSGQRRWRCSCYYQMSPQSPRTDVYGGS